MIDTRKRDISMRIYPFFHADLLHESSLVAIPLEMTI